MLPPAVSRPVPQDVRTSCQLWYSALAVGVVQAIASLLAQLGDRSELAQQMFDQMRSKQQPVTLAQVQVWVMVLLVLVSLLWLVLTAAGAAVVYQLWRGKNWARAVLTGYALFLVLGAGGTMIGAGTTVLDKPGGSATAGVVAGCAAIVQAVLAGGAVFLCYQKESEAYFRPGPQ